MDFAMTLESNWASEVHNDRERAEKGEGNGLLSYQWALWISPPILINIKYTKHLALFSESAILQQQC